MCLHTRRGSLKTHCSTWTDPKTCRNFCLKSFNGVTLILKIGRYLPTYVGSRYDRMSSKYDSNNLFYAQFFIGLISIVIITTMEEVLMFSNILTTWSTYWAIILGNIKTKNRTKWSRILKRYKIWFKIRVYLPQQKTRGTIIILLIQSFLSCQSIHQFEIRTFNSPR